MRLLLVILVLTVSAWATPLLVTRHGEEVRVTPAPEWTRARIEGTRLVWDLAWKGAVDATDVSVSRPQPGVVRLTCPVPPGKTPAISRSRISLRLSLTPSTPVPQGKRVSQDFVNVDIVYVLKVLAKDRGYNIYIGPGVEGTFTGSLRSVRPEAALAVLLSELDGIDYKVVRHGEASRTFVVAPNDKLATVPDEIPVCPVSWSIPDAVRQEILLERAPMAPVIEFLQGQYKNVQFTPHPTRNGFYVYGARKDVLQIRSEVPNLDRTPEPPPPPVTEECEIEQGDPEKVRASLAALVPGVDYQLDGRTLTLTGRRDDVESARELLVEFTQPRPQILVDSKLLFHSPALTKWFALPESGSTVLKPGPPLQSDDQTKVVAAPRAVTVWDQETEFFFGEFGPSPDSRIGLTVRLVPERVNEARLVLHVGLDWQGVEPESYREYSFELSDHQTVALSNVVSAERLEAFRRRPDVMQSTFLGPVARSVPVGLGLTLLLTPHMMR